MPVIRFDRTLMRLMKDVNDIRSALRRVTVNLPLYDINNENTPAQITADQDDYVIGNYDVLRLSTDQAGRTLTGLKGGVKGRKLRIINIGSYEFLLAHQSASSDPENRIISPTETDVLINADGEISLYYDSTQSRWVASYGAGGDRISCDLELSGVQSIPDSAFTDISWTSIIKDTGNFFSALNPTYITIPSSGWYVLRTHIAWNANLAGVRHHLIRSVAGVSYAHDKRNFTPGSGVDMDLTRVMYLPINTQVKILVWQNSGAALDVLVAGSAGVRTSFNVARM